MNFSKLISHGWLVPDSEYMHKDAVGTLLILNNRMASMPKETLDYMEAKGFTLNKTTNIQQFLPIDQVACEKVGKDLFKQDTSSCNLIRKDAYLILPAMAKR